MLTVKRIKEELEGVLVVSVVTGIYQDIANWRMNQIKKRVLQTREFLDGLNEVYRSAKKSYIISSEGKDKNSLRNREAPNKEADGVRSGQHPDSNKNLLKTRQQKKGEVAVFLSANTHFYGALILDIWRFLLSYLGLGKEEDIDLVIVGKIGRYLTEPANLRKKTFYFDLDDDKPREESIKNISEFIGEYAKVTVFHGRFETVISQRPAQSNISLVEELMLEEKTHVRAKSYLFEPSPEAILEFFETEILAALFNQTVLEHQLSKFAARTIAMYQATENAKKIKNILEIKKRKLERQVLNKKQNEIFGGFQLWSYPKT